MDYMLAILEDREKGQFPVSIGTSLALESAAGIYPDRPESPAPIGRVKEIWVNMRTLIRNVANGLSADQRSSLIPEHLHAVVREELSIISAAVPKMSNGGCRTVFYACDHSRLHRRYPHATLRIPTTDKQILQTAVDEGALHLLLGDYGTNDVRVFDNSDLQGSQLNAFVITHQPHDLLSRYRFQRLELLESHTGAIKGPAAWNSKLTGGKELHYIPFNAFTLQVFGDNGGQFAPKGIGLRRALLEQAQKDRWSNVSTMDRIRSSVNKLQNKEQREELLRLM